LVVEEGENYIFVHAEGLSSVERGEMTCTVASNNLTAAQEVPTMGTAGRRGSNYFKKKKGGKAQVQQKGGGL